MAQYPEKLQKYVQLFEMIPDRSERIETLIGIADRYRPVPAEVAKRPYPEEHRVKQCESQVYIFAQPQDKDTLKFHFAVENPQGISAMATAVVLDESLSGAPLPQVIQVPGDIIYKFFGNELSMGKSMGLTGMIEMVKRFARTRLATAQVGLR